MVDLKKRRWGKHFTDSEIAFARENNRLLTMEIETSHVCNLKCIYCYNSAGKKLERELSFDEIIDIIDQGVDLGVRRIILIGGGEPLMHPRILDIIDNIAQRNLGIDLFTNGMFIDKPMAKKLYDFGVEPVVKCNSLIPKIQDYLVNLEGAFKHIQDSISYLMEAGYPTQDKDLGIETIICSYNYEEIPTMWRWARDREITPYFEMITFQGRAKKRKDLNVSVEDLKKLFYRLSEIDREEYGYEWEPHPPVAALNCSRHEYSCTITSNGYVQPCTGVDIKVGNIRYARLEEILQTSVVIKTLRDIRNDIKGDCKKCEMVSKCYGCRGMAYHLTGDFLASDPLCWKNSRHSIE